MGEGDEVKNILYSLAAAVVLSTMLFVRADPLGIDITSTTYDVFGVDVEFETDLVPPYILAVFFAEDNQFDSNPYDLTRAHPIRYRIVHEKRGSIAGDFWRRKGNHFVQVLSISYTNNPAFRALTVSEKESRYDELRDQLDQERPLASSCSSTVASAWSIKDYTQEPGWASMSAYLVSNHTWGVFYRSDDPNPVLKGKFRRSRDDSSFDVGEKTFGPFDTSSGTGYRVLYNEKTSEWTVHRAYSLFPHCSQEVLLVRPLKPLSMHDNLKISLDWLGQMRYQIETNAVPDRIYWEGL